MKVYASLIEHKQLAAFCRAIDKNGGYFMVSNSDTPLVRALYKEYISEVVSAPRRVSCKAHKRGIGNELIIRNYLRFPNTIVCDM